jgi:hypothetical protein
MKSIVWPAAAVLAVALHPGVMHASGPIAVYALVDQVTFEPNADKPERIRISGVFSVAVETPDNSTVYSPRQPGYLYFRLPAGKEELALREWADLKSVAGTRQVVGLGSSWGARVHVWKPGEDPKGPEDYPMGNGMVKFSSQSNTGKAKELLDYKLPRPLPPDR